MRTRYYIYPNTLDNSSSTTTPVGIMEAAEARFVSMLCEFLAEMKNVFPAHEASIKMAMAGVRAADMASPGSISTKFFQGIAPVLDRVLARDDSLLSTPSSGGDIGLGSFDPTFAKIVADGWGQVHPDSKQAIWDYLHLLSGMSMALHYHEKDAVLGDRACPVDIGSLMSTVQQYMSPENNGASTS